MNRLRRFTKNFFFPTLQNSLKPYALSFETFITVIGLTFLLEISFYSYLTIFKNNAAYQIMMGRSFLGRPTVTAETVRQVAASSRLLVENVLLVLLVYVLAVVFIPMAITFFNHRSNSLRLRLRETDILFKEPIRWAKWTIFMIVVLYFLNYFLSAIQ